MVVAVLLGCRCLRGPFTSVVAAVVVRGERWCFRHRWTDVGSGVLKADAGGRSGAGVYGSPLAFVHCILFAPPYPQRIECCR